MKKKNRGTADSFLFGKARLECADSYLIPMLNVLLSMGESYSNIVSADGVASVDIAYISARRAVALCRASGIEAKAVLLSGLPYYFGRLLSRPGLIAGMALGLLILILGNSVLWDIRVVENEAIETAEVKNILAEYGVKPGAWLSRIDVGDIQTRIERDSEEIAWMSINVIGTVAYVEVIPEIDEPPEDGGEGDGANLVAERDGVIVGFELIAGEPTVEIGRTVRKGELIASGLYDSERLGFRATHAKGSVFARTEYLFEAEIPYEYTVREAQSSEISEISIIFFSFRQKFFKKGGFSGTKYDKIYSDIYIYSSGDATIPIGLSVTRVPIFAERAATRTPAEAVDIAYFEINHKILASIPEAEILSKSFSGGENADGTAYRLECRVECIDDIAEPVPFYINRSE
ncbi:MAG: sporulation protein YqfD [Clostridia bacterium]|nr:sporulation protein YqfD [Clostridia bacterium]